MPVFEYLKPAAVALAILVIGACNQRTPDPVVEIAPAVVEPASKVFTNAKVYTVSDEQPWAEAVAVSGNKIVFVGDAAAAEAYVGEDTERIDLAGKMVLPGFVSGHDHLVASNWTKAGVNLFPGESKADYLALIKAHAEANPDDEFLYGYGWNYTTYGGRPTAADLDSVAPNHKAILFDFTIHDAWLNTALLKAGGIDKNTVDEQPGFSYWERDADGNPTGNAIELAWFAAYVGSGAWNPEVLVSGSQQVLYDGAASQGWTAVNNVGLVTPNISDEEKNYKEYDFAMKMLHELELAGDLKLRTFMHMMYKNGEIEPQGVVDRTVEYRQKYDSDMLRLAAIKIHPEANWGTHTSLLLEGYKDKPEYTGIRGITALRVDEMIKAANAKGLDVSTHVDGSATVRATLDSILASRADGNPDERNSLQHFAVVHPDDIKRAGDNKVPVNITPLWRTDWGNGYQLALDKLGGERTHNYFQMLGTIARSGTTVSISGDVPSTPQEESSALNLLESAMTQKNPRDPDSKPWGPKSEALTLEEGLRTLTVNPAWQVRMEDKLGTLEVGKYADLVVLEQNLFEVAPQDIADVKVMGTLMNGEFTHRDGI